MTAVKNVHSKPKLECAGGISGSDLPDTDSTNTTGTNKPGEKQVKVSAC